MPTSLVVLESSGPVAKRRTEMRSYRLGGGKTLRGVLHSKSAVPHEMNGGYPSFLPGPRGDRFARTMVDSISRRAVVSLWSAAPLRRAGGRGMKGFLDAHWLYGSDALVTVETIEERPVARLLSGAEGRATARYDGCLAVLDAPGQAGAMRVRTSLTVAQALAFRDGGTSAFAGALADGRIWTEESADLRRWRRIAPDLAVRRWVLSTGDLGRGLWLLRSLALSGMKYAPIGFRDHWLVARAEVSPAPSGRALPIVRDRLFLSGGRTLDYVRNEVLSGDVFYSVSPGGEALVVASTVMDDAYPPRRGFHTDPPPIAAVRFGSGGTRRFLIANPSLLGMYLVLWASTGAGR